MLFSRIRIRFLRIWQLNAEKCREEVEKRGTREIFNVLIILWIIYHVGKRVWEKILSFCILQVGTADHVKKWGRPVNIPLLRGQGSYNHKDDVYRFLVIDRFVHRAADSEHYGS